MQQLEQLQQTHAAKCACNVSVCTVQAFSLGEQIEHKVAYIQQHLSGVQSAPIAIIGHSIGESCILAWLLC